MNFDKDYYAILGVLPSIEPTALKAVYLALLKKYHPDVYIGQKSEAERITKDINEAYEVLSNDVKRREYDSNRQSGTSKGGDFGQTAEKTETNKTRDDELEANWKTIISYYPDCEYQREELERISKSLGFLFQVMIVSEKAAEKSKSISDSLKSEFLKRYFGDNERIQKFALKQLNLGRREVAIEINNAIRIMGTPKRENVEKFIFSVKDKFKLWDLDAAQQRKDLNATAVNKSEKRMITIWIVIGGLLFLWLFAVAFHSK